MSEQLYTLEFRAYGHQEWRRFNRATTGEPHAWDRKTADKMARVLAKAEDVEETRVVELEGER